MHRDIARSLVLLFLAGALVRAAVPAPRPWTETRRLPRGTVQSGGGAFQSGVPTPADVTDGSPQQRAAGVRAQQQRATQPEVTGRRGGRLPDGGEPGTVEEQRSGGRGGRTRRGKRTRRRGCRGRCQVVCSWTTSDTLRPPKHSINEAEVTRTACRD